MIEHDENNVKMRSTIIAVILGSLTLFFLIAITYIVLTMICGTLFSLMAFTEIKTHLTNSIWPTTLALAYFGYKLPTEFKSDKENYQIAFRYTILVNITYWIAFLLLNLIEHDISKPDIIIAIIGFTSGILLWPFTLGAIIISASKKIINK